MSLQSTMAHGMTQKSQGHLPLGVKPVPFLKATRAVAQVAVERLRFISSHLCRKHRVRQQRQ